jgi:hypothetical protein
MAAGDHVVEADPLAGPEAAHRSANLRYHPGDFMAESQRKWAGRGAPRPVMSVGVANACGAHLDQHILRSSLWDGQLLQLEGPARLAEPYSFHFASWRPEDFMYYHMLLVFYKKEFVPEAGTKTRTNVLV